VKKSGAILNIFDEAQPFDVAQDEYCTAVLFVPIGPFAVSLLAPSAIEGPKFQVLGVQGLIGDGIR